MLKNQFSGDSFYQKKIFLNIFFPKKFLIKFFDIFDEKSSENRFLSIFMPKNTQKNFWKIFFVSKIVSKNHILSGFLDKYPPTGAHLRLSDQKTGFTIVFSAKFWVYTDCAVFFIVESQNFRLSTLKLLYRLRLNCFHALC